MMMVEEKPEAPKDVTPQAPTGEMSREEKIAAAKAKAEALKAQRAAAGADSRPRLPVLGNSEADAGADLQWAGG